MTKARICLIEDTEVMNSGYSILIDLLTTKTNILFNQEIVYWGSPCWESTSIGEPLLFKVPSFTKQFIEKKSLPKLANVNFCEWSVNDYKDCVSIAVHILNSCRSTNGEVKLKELMNFRFNNIAVGQACVSMALRFYAKSNITHNINYEELLPPLIKLLCAMNYFNKAKPSLIVDYFFSSESVYLASAMLEYFLREGAVSPFLYSIDSPIWIQKKHLDDRNGVSPRLVAFREQTQDVLLLLPDTNSWMKRYHGCREINSPTKLQVQEVVSLGGEIASLNNRKYLDSFSQIKFNNIYKYDLHFAFYLHAITDGPFMHGVSGYITPYEFYLDVITSISNALRQRPEFKASCQLRLHPNLLHGQSSPYASHQNRSRDELIYTATLVKLLSDQCEATNLNCFVGSPALPSKHVLSQPGCIIVSHHGSIGLEAYVLGLPVITSSISPLAELKDPAVVIKILNEPCETELLRLYDSANKGISVRLSPDKMESIWPHDRYSRCYYQTLSKALCSKNGFDSLSQLDHELFNKGPSHEMPSILKKIEFDTPSVSKVLKLINLSKPLTI